MSLQSETARRDGTALPVARGEVLHRRGVLEAAIAPRVDGNYVIVEVAHQRYAFAIAHVREVVPRAALTRLPNSPEAVAGVLRLRGSLLPVIDLRVRLDLPTAAPRMSQRIVVAQVAQHLVGFLVDAVHGLLTLEDQVEPAPSAADGLACGVAETGTGVVMILNPKVVVADDVLAVLTNIQTGRRQLLDAGTPDGQTEDRTL